MRRAWALAALLAGASATAAPVITKVPSVVIVDMAGRRMVCIAPIEAETPGIFLCWSMGETATTCRLVPTVRCDIPLPRDPAAYPSKGDPA